jgi:hypothetical protein
MAGLPGHCRGSLSGGAIVLGSRCAGEERRCIAVQYLLARLLADFRFRERLGSNRRRIRSRRCRRRCARRRRAARPPRSHAGRTSCNRHRPWPCGNVKRAAPPPACRAGSGGPCARPRTGYRADFATKGSVLPRSTRATRASPGEGGGQNWPESRQSGHPKKGSREPGLITTRCRVLPSYRLAASTLAADRFLLTSASTASPPRGTI